jgi:hypothetical protein
MVPTESRLWLILGAIGNSFHFLLPMILLALWPLRKTASPIEFRAMEPKPFLIIAAALVLAVFVLVIGPGVEF